MADYELAMDLNLRSVLVTTEAAIPEMRARGGGALLYTASTSGLVGSAFSPVYSMAKFGVVGFVRRQGLAPTVSVNAVSGTDRHADGCVCRPPDQRARLGEEGSGQGQLVAQPADPDAPHRPP
jgi:NAD(P)-dependent dehydrogenase (short-subunit alcohol dehydrogenase family)